MIITMLFCVWLIDPYIVAVIAMKRAKEYKEQLIHIEQIQKALLDVETKLDRRANIIVSEQYTYNEINIILQQTNFKVNKDRASSKRKDNCCDEDDIGMNIDDDDEQEEDDGEEQKGERHTWE
jgi:hypothetical protein